MSPHRPPRSCTVATLCSVFLAACQLGPPPGKARDSIDAAVDEARRSAPPPRLPPHVAQALLPPAGAGSIAAPALPEPRFDLVVNQASPAQVFHAIASGSRYSIVLAPKSNANSISLNLKEATVHEALDVLRELYGYEYRIDGTRIHVQAATLQTRVLRIAYPSARRNGRTDTRAVSGSVSNAPNAANAQPGSSTASEGSQVATLHDADFWKEMDAALKAIVGSADGRQVVLSPHSGVLVVRAFPRELREVEQFLRASRIAVERQVMLEAKIVEVTLSEGFESGVNWSAFDGAGNHRFSVGADAARVNVPGSIGRGFGVPSGSVVTAVDPSTTPPTVVPTTLAQLLSSPFASGGAGVLGMAFTTNSFAGLLAFLETQGSVHVLSSPRVAATNNQKAVLRVGSDDFFITNVSTSTTTTAAGSVTTPTIQTQPFFSGISLDVTPQIDDDDHVTLHVRPTVSQVSERTRIVNLGNLGNFTLPLASSTVNEADTVVRVRDGVTVALGGLMSQAQNDNDTKLPGAGDVPLVGQLFKRTQRTLQKRELVFLLKPTVIRNDAAWSADLSSTRDRLRGLAGGTRPGGPAPGAAKE